MSQELKPCPFCGCDKIEVKQYRRDGLEIGCPKCIIKYQQRTIYKSLTWLESVMREKWNSRYLDTDNSNSREVKKI